MAEKAMVSREVVLAFPRTYRIDLATRRFFQGFAIFLVIFFSAMTCLHLTGVFARPLSHGDLVWMNLLVVLYAIWSISWANRVVILNEQSIEITGWFGKRALQRGEIEGVRMGRLPVTAGGTSYYIIVPTDRGKRELKLPPFLHTDQQFRSWIASLPRLGRQDSITEPPHIRAHKHCFKNRDELLRSQTCGCFYCLAIFAPSEVTHWIDEEQTAMCPKCDIDSVIGSASGFSIDAKFLKKMELHWFGINPNQE
jgi:hypothetical protein